MKVIKIISIINQGGEYSIIPHTCLWMIQEHTRPFRMTEALGMLELTMAAGCSAPVIITTLLESKCVYSQATIMKRHSRTQLQCASRS